MCSELWYSRVNWFKDITYQVDEYAQLRATVLGHMTHPAYHDAINPWIELLIQDLDQ